MSTVITGQTERSATHSVVVGNEAKHHPMPHLTHRSPERWIVVVLVVSVCVNIAGVGRGAALWSVNTNEPHKRAPQTRHTTNNSQLVSSVLMIPTLVAVCQEQTNQKTPLITEDMGLKRP